MKNSHQGELLTDIILKIFHLNGALNAVGDQITAEFGLTSARWKVMGAIAVSQTMLCVPDIAIKMGLSRQAVQRLVNEMNQSKLVMYTDNPNHRRSKYIELTKHGQHIYKQVEHIQRPWAKGLSQQLAPQNLSATLSTLEQLSQILKT